MLCLSPCVIFAEVLSWNVILKPLAKNYPECFFFFVIVRTSIDGADVNWTVCAHIASLVKDHL